MAQHTLKRTGENFLLKIISDIYFTIMSVRNNSNPIYHDHSVPRIKPAPDLKARPAYYYPNNDVCTVRNDYIADKQKIYFSR